MNELEALAAGLVAVTEYGFPGRPISTVRGPVDFGEWCRDEARRLETLGRRTAIIERGRSVALFATAIQDVGRKTVARRAT